MTIVWMLYVLLVGALLALGARAVASALGLAGRSTRWVWATALIGIAALAAVAPRQRSVDIAAMDAGRAHTESVAPIADASRGAGLVAMLDAARTTVALTAVRAIAAANARIPAALAGPAAFGWAPPCWAWRWRSPLAGPTTGVRLAVRAPSAQPPHRRSGPTCG